MKRIVCLLTSMITLSCFAADDFISIKNNSNDTQGVMLAYVKNNYIYPDKSGNNPEIVKLLPGVAKNLKRLDRRLGYDRDIIVATTGHLSKLNNGGEDAELKPEKYFKTLNVGTLKFVSNVEINKDGKPVKVS
jgi:hypothetical protein